VFPANYHVYHSDRPDGYEGVFVACQDTIPSCNVQLDEASCEIVACKIQLPNQPSLVICSVYRPPLSNLTYLVELCQQLECIR